MLGCQLQLALVLLAEAVAGGEEVPAALLVHVPDVGLLASVLRLVLVDEVHQEEPEEEEETGANCKMETKTRDCILQVL